MDPEIEVQPGDLVFLQIGGWLGFWIRILQAVAGDFSWVTHVAIVLSGGEIIAAQPGGARIDPIESLLGKRRIAFSRYDLSADQRVELERLARALEKNPYSFLDYGYIGLLKLGFRCGWLLHRVEASGHMICSQMADRLLEDVGCDLFTDGRAHGAVTPGAIYGIGLIQNVPNPSMGD